MIGKNMKKEKILLDTCILIDFLRRGGKKSIFYKLMQMDEYDLFVSSITVAELYSGKSVWESKKALDSVRVLLSGLKVLNVFSNKCCMMAGKIRASEGLGLGDSLIVAVAKNEKMRLATLNLKHFKKVEGLKLVDLKKI